MSATRDNHTDMLTRKAIDNVAITDTTPVVGNTIDMFEFSSLEFVAGSGATATASAGSIQLTMEDSEDGTVFSAVPSDDELGGGANFDLSVAYTNTTRRIGYIGKKQFVRLVATGVGNNGQVDFSAAAILGHPRHQAQPQSSE